MSEVKIEIVDIRLVGDRVEIIKEITIPFPPKMLDVKLNLEEK